VWKGAGREGGGPMSTEQFLRATLVDVEPDLPARARQAYERELRDASARCDRMFVQAFFAQWILAVALALFFSPHAWEGKTHSIHNPVLFAVVFGAILTGSSVVLVRFWPGRAVTRQSLAIGQMLWSAAIIHLTGGRIESHFHVFGSLGFVAFYRDVRALIAASVFVAADLVVRGSSWPESVYGTSTPEWWRFVEHVLWIAFEDAVLLVSIVRGRRALAERAAKQAELELLNQTLERKVARRTSAFTASNARLMRSMNELKLMQARLVEASRRAGMADVATSVLHNVGNVLNSVNVSANLIAKTTRASVAADGLRKVLGLLAAQRDLAVFFGSDPRARSLPTYLEAIATQLDRDRENTTGEVAQLTRNIDHIKVIVSMQQSHAKVGGVIEKVSLPALIDEALKLNAASSERHRIRVVRQIEGAEDVDCDRHKLLQILMNLLGNACQALRECPRDRTLTVRTHVLSPGTVAIDVTDNGVGIAPDIAARIFHHGFTTKRDGHGFGLHASACAATEIGGRLSFHSDGVGHGATFTLSLPRAAVESAPSSGHLRLAA
jgi:signal transduction histidine kinase